MRGDLDWIVMKALEKDRTRRYDSAGGLARDIERHLDGDPVEAGPPSAVLSAEHVRAKAPAGACDGDRIRRATGADGPDQHLAGHPRQAGRGPGQRQPAQGAGRRSERQELGGGMGGGRGVFPRQDPVGGEADRPGRRARP